MNATRIVPTARKRATSSLSGLASADNDHRRPPLSMAIRSDPPVIDLYARKPVGWALSPNTELVKKALTMAWRPLPSR